MSIFKSSFIIASAVLVSSAYFYFTHNDINGSQNDAKHNVHKQPLTKPIVNVQSLKKKLEPITNEPAIQQPPLDIAYRFHNTAEYEAASIYGDLPANLTDINIEKFSYSPNGQLVINENIKHIIEFFLMASQEEGKEQAIERLKEYITLTLPADAAKQALEISETYLNYKNSLLAYDFSVEGELSDDKTISKVKASLEAKKQVRRTHLGESLSEALFGDEERYDTYSVTRVEINADKTLSDKEKNIRLAEAESHLPPKVAQGMRQNRKEKSLKTKITALQKTSGNSDEIYSLRKEFYGEKVADRMAYLEDSSDNWHFKVSQFHQEQQSINSNSELSNAEKKQLINESKLSIFSEKESIKYAVQSIRGQLAHLN